MKWIIVPWKITYFVIGFMALAKNWRITDLNFFTLGLKVEDSDSAHFFDAGSKVKVPSKLT